MNDTAAVLGLSDEEYQAKKEQTKTFLSENGVQICVIVTAVASVGILLAVRKNNRLAVKGFKLTRDFLRAQDQEAHALRKAITELKEKGLEFTYYPGLGVFEDHKLPQLAREASNHTKEIVKAREALEVLKALRGAA